MLLAPAANLYEPIESPDEVFEHPLAVAYHFTRWHPGEDGAATFRLVSQLSGGPDWLVMYFSADGYADDSVQAEEWRIQLERTEGGWRVTDAGKRVKCYRGENAGEWQKGLCP
ncbi:MAG: hypothetical protein AAGE86_10685 [Pseudomonadota bacterium]